MVDQGGSGGLSGDAAEGDDEAQSLHDDRRVEGEDEGVVPASETEMPTASDEPSDQEHRSDSVAHDRRMEGEDEGVVAASEGEMPPSGQ